MGYKTYDSSFPALPSGPEDELLLAQVSAYISRVPILYFVLSFNTILLMWTHYGAAPPVLSLYVPGAILSGIAIRAFRWLGLRKKEISTAEARRIIRRTMITGSVIALSILCWALSLLAYKVPASDGHVGGDGQVILFVGTSVIASIMMLMHVRAAATLITVIVIPPFCTFLLSRGSAIESALALNLALVSTTLLYVVNSFSRDFQGMILSKARLRHSNARNAELARTDQATGLPNRRKFFDELTAIGVGTGPYAVVLLDMDGFKQVNDLYGHIVGDSVLRVIGQRLATNVPSDVCVARLGGDEFAMLITDVRDHAAVMCLCENLIERCKIPIDVDNVIVTVGMSAGISIAGKAGEKGVSALDHYGRSDYALRHAKAAGRGRLELFSAEHRKKMFEASRIEQALQCSNFADEIEVRFQPIVRADNHALASFEALARWNSTDLGVVPPTLFIPVAERTGMIEGITRVILQSALDTARSWPDHIIIKVNLSVRDLTSPAQIVALRSIMRDSGVDPKRITFEVTESLLAESFEIVRSSIDALRCMGASIAIDDFGTGYSSLSYIHRLAPDVIKVDRSFIENIGSDLISMNIVKTVLELCRSMGAKSIAEGIENPRQAAVLTSLGCDELQGFYFGKPMSAAETVLYAAERSVPQQSSAPVGPHSVSFTQIVPVRLSN